MLYEFINWFVLLFPFLPVFSRVWSGFVECGHDYLLATWSMAYVYSIFSVRVCAFLFCVCESTCANAHSMLQGSASDVLTVIQTLHMCALDFYNFLCNRNHDIELIELLVFIVIVKGALSATSIVLFFVKLVVTVSILCRTQKICNI